MNRFINDAIDAQMPPEKTEKNNRPAIWQSGFLYQRPKPPLGQVAGFEML